MKILIIVGAFPPAFELGGPVRTNYYLSRALIAQGHELFVLTTDIGGNGQRHNVPHIDTDWEGIPVRYCRWEKGWLPYHSPELKIEAERRVTNYDIVLLHGCWTEYSVSAAKACQRAKVPYLMYPHGSYSPLRLQESKFRKILWWQLIDKPIFQRARGVVALTQAEISEVRQMGIRNVPIAHIPNGVDLASFQQRITREALDAAIPALKGQKYLLFLGRFDPIKGIDLLIEAYARSSADALLVLAGPEEDGYRAEMQKKVTHLNLTDRVIFPGMINDTLKAALISDAELFALTSRGEGLAMSTLEAMACGTPLLITPGCNLPEVAEANAGRIVPLEVEAIAQAIKQLLATPELLAEMGKNAIELVQRSFTWESVAEKTVAFCQSLLA